MRQTLLIAFLALWLNTLRVRWCSPLPTGAGVIGLWHRDLPVCMPAFRDFGVISLISASADGDLAAGVSNHFSIRAVRGSSSRGYLSIRPLVNWLKSGGRVGMALDGPRGPAGVEKPGARWLAQQSARPLYRVQVHYPRGTLRLPTWDGTCLPLPFSAVTLELQLENPRPIP